MTVLAKTAKWVKHHIRYLILLESDLRKVTLPRTDTKNSFTIFRLSLYFRVPCDLSKLSDFPRLGVKTLPVPSFGHTGAPRTNTKNPCMIFRLSLYFRVPCDGLPQQVLRLPSRNFTCAWPADSYLPTTRSCNRVSH